MHLHPKTPKPHKQSESILLIKVIWHFVLRSDAGVLFLVKDIEASACLLDHNLKFGIDLLFALSFFRTLLRLWQIKWSINLRPGSDFFAHNFSNELSLFLRAKVYIFLTQLRCAVQKQVCQLWSRHFASHIMFDCIDFLWLIKSSRLRVENFQRLTWLWLLE